MMRLHWTLAAVLLLVPTVATADPLPPELALVPTDAAAFVSVRLDLLTAGKAPLFGDLLRQPELVKELENGVLGFPPAEVERVTVVYPALPVRDPAAYPPVLVVTRTKRIDRGALLRKLEARPFTPNWADGPRAGPPPTRRVNVFATRRDIALCFAGERTLLLTTHQGGPVLLDLFAQLVDPSPEAPLAPALAAAGKNALVVGATGAAFTSLVGLWPDRDRELEALGKAEVITLVAHPDPDFNLTLKADFRDQATARDGLAALTAVTGWATEALKDLGAGPEKSDAEASRLLLAALRGAGPPVRDGKTITLAIRMKADEFVRASTSLTESAVARVRTAAFRAKSFNNLKQIGLAVWNYHDTNGQFPFNDRPMGAPNPGLSWRVAILPYIEADDLYKQFKLDEPWDSEHNKKLIEKMPKVFAPLPGIEAKPGHTFYRMFDGPGTMSQMKTVTDVTDGTSNTLMVVEAAEPVVWTKPDELPYDPKLPLPKLGGQFRDGFCALLGDGSVRFVRKGIDEKVLRAIITANGGETVRLDDK
jgi:hypothetical protein